MWLSQKTYLSNVCSNSGVGFTF